MTNQYVDDQNEFNKLNFIQQKQLPIRSFVRRFGRMTAGQKRNLKKKSKVIIDFEKINHQTNWRHIFELSSNDSLKLTLDIGFGMGDGTIEFAKNNLDHQILSIDIHKPGIGRLLGLIEKNKISNIRIIEADIIDLLTQKIADNSFALIKILFPDPWPKSRHHKRRLISENFLNLLSKKTTNNALLHIVTDNQDYANWITKLFLEQKYFNPIEPKIAKTLPVLACLKTKFYQRAILENREIYNFYYQK